MLQKVKRASEHNLVLVLGWSMWNYIQLQEESESSLRQINIFFQTSPVCHLAEIQPHV